MGDLQGWFAENNMGLRLEITSVDKDLSRAPSLCFSKTSVYALLVSRRAEPVCITEKVSQGSGRTIDDTEWWGGPDMSCNPILMFKLKIAFSVRARRQFLILLICCSMHSFLACGTSVAFSTIFRYDPSLADHKPLWPGFVIGNTAGRTGTLCSLSRSGWAAMRVDSAFHPLLRFLSLRVPLPTSRSPWTSPRLCVRMQSPPP